MREWHGRVGAEQSLEGYWAVVCFRQTLWSHLMLAEDGADDRTLWSTQQSHPLVVFSHDQQEFHLVEISSNHNCICLKSCFK